MDPLNLPNPSRTLTHNVYHTEPVVECYNYVITRSLTGTSLKIGRSTVNSSGSDLDWEWNELSGPRDTYITSRPCAAYVLGTLHVFARCGDMKIWHRSLVPDPNGMGNDVWDPEWQDLNGISLSPPVVVYSDTRLSVLARGTDSKLYQRRFDANVSGQGFIAWEQVPVGDIGRQPSSFVMYSDPTVNTHRSMMGGPTAVFAKGNDGHSWGRLWDADRQFWTDWQDLGGRLTSDVCAIHDKDYRGYHLFGRDENMALMYQWWNVNQNPTGQWTSLRKGGWLGSGAVGFLSDEGTGHTLHLIARGRNMKLYYKRYDAKIHFEDNDEVWQLISPLSSTIAPTEPTISYSNTNAYIFLPSLTADLLYVHGMVSIIIP